MDNFSDMFNAEEFSFANQVYNIALCEVHGYDNADDTDSVISFEEKVVTTKCNLNRVLKLFKSTNKAKKLFLKNFGEWYPTRKTNIESLLEIAEQIQLDRFNGNIAKIVGGCAGIAGAAAVGASLLCPPLLAVTVPLGIAGGVVAGLGGATIVGTTITEIVLLKNSLEKAQKLIEQEEESFTQMTHWFKHSQALVEALEEILGEDTLTDVLDEVKTFFEEGKDQKDFQGGKYNHMFQSLMKSCLSKMSSDVTAKFGAEMAPMVMSFIFVSCLMSKRNRIVLNCAMVTQRLALGLLSATDVGVEVGRLIAGLVLKGGAAAGKVVPGAVARSVAVGVFLVIGAVLDVINVAISSREIHRGTLSEQAVAIRNAADQLKEEMAFFQSVHDELNH